MLLRKKRQKVYSKEIDRTDLTKAFELCSGWSPSSWTFYQVITILTSDFLLNYSKFRINHNQHKKLHDFHLSCTSFMSTQCSTLNFSISNKNLFMFFSAEFYAENSNP